MSKKYRLVPVGTRLDEWEDLVLNSKQGTIFSLPNYLEAAGCRYMLYFVIKGNEIKAGVSLNIDADERKALLDDLVIYNGIIFRNDLLQKTVKSKQEQFEITEFVLAELDGFFDAVEMALHPSFQDLRPVLWHNYGSKDLNKKYRCDLRYTSYLDISEFFLRRNEEAMTLFYRMDNIRQSDIKKARKENLVVTEDTCTDKFVELYSNLMSSQGKEVPFNTLNRIKTLVNKLLAENAAKLYKTTNSSGKITYITIFTHYSNHACYLFGAGDPEVMKRYDGTICLWDSFKSLASYGIQEIDMEGVNSPQRGWFKMSFDGSLLPYYQIYRGMEHE